MAVDFAEVTTEDMIRYLHGVGVNKGCPRCDSDRWTLGSFDDKTMTTYAYFRSKAPDGNVEMGEYWPVYLVACQQCGFVTHYGALRVMKWVKDNPPMAEGTE